MHAHACMRTLRKWYDDDVLGGIHTLCINICVYAMYVYILKYTIRTSIYNYNEFFTVAKGEEYSMLIVMVDLKNNKTQFQLN